MQIYCLSNDVNSHKTVLHWKLKSILVFKNRFKKAVRLIYKNNMSKPSIILIRFSIATVFLVSFLFYFINCARKHDNLAQDIIFQLYFLTNWNWIIQIIYFILCTLNALQLYLSKKEKDTIRKLDVICNTLYTSLAFPLGSLVVVSFWLIYAIDRELIYPSRLDSLIPIWLNHVMHTLPLVACLIEMALVNHNYPRFVKGVLLSVMIGIAYLVWIFYIAFTTGFWVYEMLNVMDSLSKGLFIFSQLSFIAIAYKTGELLNRSLWKNKID